MGQKNIMRKHVIKSFSNYHSVFVCVLSGLNVGCFYAVSTLLNRMIIEHYPVSSVYVTLYETKHVKQTFTFTLNEYSFISLSIPEYS